MGDETYVRRSALAPGSTDLPLARSRSPCFSMLWPLCRIIAPGTSRDVPSCPLSPPFRLVYSAREMVARRASWNGSRMSTVIPAESGAT